MKDYKDHSDLDAEEKIIKRLFPGIGVYSGMKFGEVMKVHNGSGKHARIKPVACCDIQILDASLDVDRRFDVMPEINLVRMSRHMVDVPRKGDIIVFCFPYWQAHTAIIFGVLYVGHQVETSEGTQEFEGADEMRFGSAEDFMVLADELISMMEDMGDIIISIGQAGNMGAPLTKYPEALANWETLKTTLPLIKSAIKLGKYTKRQT